MALSDSSAKADAEGVRVHMIRSGEHKGVGLAGVKITNKNIESLQRNVNSLARIMINYIAKGSGVPSSKIRQLATGEMWVGLEAKQKGLIDAVENKLFNIGKKVGDAPPLKK